MDTPPPALLRHVYLALLAASVEITAQALVRVLDPDALAERADEMNLLAAQLAPYVNGAEAADHA